AAREQPRRIRADVAAVRCRRLQPHEGLRERGARSLLRILDAQVGVVHDEGARLLLDREMTVVGAANSDAVVTGCRLDPNVVEPGLAQDASVGDAVEADTAGNAEVACTGRFL